jgi:hypothetical protein
MRALFLSVIAALCIGAAPAAGQSPKRVALMIGNDAYQSLSHLDNPRLDAGRLAGILAANGFDG